MLKLVSNNERKTQPANYRMMHNFCAFHLMCIYNLEFKWKILFPFGPTYFIITTYLTSSNIAMASNDDFHLMAEGFYILLWCVFIHNHVFPNHDISMFSFVNNVYEMLVHIHYSYIISIRVCFVKNCMVIRGYLVRQNNTPRPIEAHKQSIETTHIEYKINNKLQDQKE